jgi:hypothetical protein
MLAGALAMVVGMISPAAAGPNGNGWGWDNNHSTETQVVDPAPTTTTTVADTNGANGDCGSYCPSGVGLPSGNGNGDGNATGQPCAGCVGNADDKNPPGQFKDGSDHNNGYECDGNNGIGKTNPAHTGCVVPVELPTTTTIPPSCTGDNCEPTTTTTTAPGETPTTVAGTQVLGEQFNRPDAAAPVATGPLAFTGGPFAGLFWAGLILVLVGTALAVRRRRVQADE